MKIFQNSILTIIFRLILGSLFIYAAIEKIIDPFGFAADIRNYEIFPTIFSNSLAIYLPWIELYCGIFLLIGVFSRSNASIIAVLLIYFVSRSLRLAPRTGDKNLINKIGVVKTELSPEGFVTVFGERWSSVSINNETIEKNSKVKIVEIDGNVLKVEKI